MEQQKIDFLPRLWNLFETVREGAAYLTEHPDSAPMRADVAAGLHTLQRHLSFDKKLSGAVGVLSSLAARLESGRTWDAACTKQLDKAAVRLAEQFSTALLDLIRPDAFLPREQAQPIFSFLAKIPHQCAAVYQLIFDVCAKAARSMPQESFEWTLRALEEHPELFSGGKAHPDYRYRPTPQHTFERCPICGGAGTPYYRAFSFNINTFEPPHLPVKLWMKCGGCGNLYTWQYPEALLTQAEHPEIVRPDKEKALTATRQTNAFALSIWSTILNRLRGYTDGKDLLEVGIGEGCLLAVALEMGYRPDAVEIVRQSAQQVADILRIPIWNGDFLDYHPDKQYAVIIMGDVIEHVTDPARALRNAHSLLADGGVLWLSTPNFEGSFTRMMKFSDPMWSEPYHISYFNYDGLRTLAEKCGFAVREYQASNRYNGLMELILTKV